MDATTVRRHAEAHAAAMAGGDLLRAGDDLTSETQARARDVMREFPRPIAAAEVISVEDAGGGEYVAPIRYSGQEREVTVESRWAEQDGRPKIVELGLAGS